MKHFKYKLLLSTCLSAALVLGPAAYSYADAVITPLEESTVAHLGEEGNGAPGQSGLGGQNSSGGQNSAPGQSGSGGQNSAPGQNSSGVQNSTPGQSGSVGQNGTPGQSSSGVQNSAPGQSGSGVQNSAPGQNSSGGQNGSAGTQGTGPSAPSQSQTGPQNTAPLQGVQGSGQTENQVPEPVIASEGAVLLDASTGTVLYGKSAEAKYYPASITKLMTALLVAENCSLDDTVTFSAAATTNLEAGAVSLNLTEGDKLTVRQCLYALLLKSANEVGNALAEHVAGSNAKFADMMNAKAAALGCANTHFTNPHGLNDPNHYTTPHDMALIARAAFENATVRTVAGTTSYSLPATIKNGARTISMGHKMLYSGDSRYYPGIIGGKTGYTSKAGNTLVTVAERDGVRLIAVVMKSKSTHYTDTKALLDYGFQVVKQQSSGQADASSQPGGPGTAAAGWIQDQNGWYYVQADGTRAAGRWLTLDGQDYWFDADAYMAHGWRKFDNGAWYYFHSGGAMARNCWIESSGAWFYLGSDGVMMTNTTTPDGYRVDENGVWVQ